MTVRPYDAVLCDIDGVVRHWPVPGHADLDLAHGFPPGTLAGAAFSPDLLHPAITGQITDERWRAEVAARIGVAKPDPRVYFLAAEQARTPPQRCLFIDDTPANVAAAREAGMTALHYRRAEDLREALSPLFELTR